ncbi:MAG: peptidylprolyl isomerase [Candidatus Poribacteria bacterium]|nr:peptidylprolyl isomerase [Candidatus Poribacteria bacterium]
MAQISIPITRDSIGLFVALLTLIACCGCEKSNPTVLIETNKGEIVIELYPDAAPKTVENFATLIQQGFYDGLTFHRYAPGFVIQGGDPKGDGSGGPGWAIHGEFQDPKLRAKMPKHEKGVVAMARTGDPDSAGSQFYICLNPDPNRYSHLDGQYTTFGRVIEGLDVVDGLRKGDQMDKVTLKHYRPE